MKPKYTFSPQWRKSSPSFLKIGVFFKKSKREGEQEKGGEDKVVDKIAHDKNFGNWKLVNGNWKLEAERLLFINKLLISKLLITNFTIL